MKTKITITFETELEPEKLKELLGELYATCSEDSEGYSWTKGSYQIETTNEK